MRLFTYIALSLGLHLLLVGIFQAWEPLFFHKDSTFNQPVEVTYVKDDKKTPDVSKDKTFVKQVEVPENLKFEDPNDAAFTSENRQRVLLETRAQESGLTRNRNSNVPKFLQDDTPPQAQNERRRAQELEEEGFRVFDPKKEFQKIDGGPSTISVKLPDDIAVGSFTALNTDRNIYYNFYSRLEDMIYLRWSELIRRAVDSYSMDFKRRTLSGRSYKTNVVVLLKPNGEFHQAQIHSASGMEKFDISPALAFQDARIFPNPPPEMVRDDGYIHISYSFVVDFGRGQ